MNESLIEKLLLENTAFERNQIEKRLVEGNFSSIARFELFIWDLELFLQFQKRLGEKIILKGGAAAQFHIPIATQRTSIDIDMICLASPEDIAEAIYDIEEKLSDADGNFKFKLHEPKKPRLSLDKLKTYYVKVPSICSENELRSSGGSQEVKCEFIFSSGNYPYNAVQNPELFALETRSVFNVLALEYLLAEKLTTLGPTTIGIPDDRIDEQFKQLYDVMALIASNYDWLITQKDCVRDYYVRAAIDECEIHNIQYSPEQLFASMNVLINRIMNIEYNASLLNVAHDFQSLYLRKEVNRDKAQWAIVGFQLKMFIEYLFRDDEKFTRFREIENLIERISFSHIRGPERGDKIRKVREILKLNFAEIEGLSADIYNKRLDRIIWELASKTPYNNIADSLKKLVIPS
jgi:predicted nucleotidyltransferase component of viral defense system